MIIPRKRSFPALGFALVLFVGFSGLGGTPVAGVSRIGQGKDAIKVVVVQGSPYEMGRQLGAALGGEIDQTLSAFLAYTKKEMPGVPVEAVLDQAWSAQERFIDKRVIEEMKGLSEGSGVPLEKLRRCHMIPVVSPYSCSGVVLWGRATRDGHTYQLRNLDYSMKGKLQDHPLVVVYRPTAGTVHANVTFAGYIASHTGMNANHVVFGEIGESPGKEMPYDLRGAHFSFLFRTLEYDAKSLADAIGITRKTPLIKRYYFFFGAGQKSGGGGVKIYIAAPDKTKFSLWRDNDPRDRLAPAVFRNCVYQTMKNDKAREYIRKHLGAFDAKRMIELSRLVAAKGNLVDVVYDADTLEMWIAFADGLERAAEQNYVHLDLHDYLK